MRTFLCFTFAIITASSPLFSQGEDVLRPKGKPDQPADASRPSKSEEKIVLGFEAGLNINFMSQPFTSDPAIENSPEEVLRSGMGFTPEIGIFVDVPVTKGMGVQFRIAYDPKAASNTLTGIIDAPDGQGNIVPMETEASYSLTMDAIAAAILLRVDLTNDLFVTVGPYLTSALGDVVRKDRLTKIGPDEAFITVDYAGTPGQYSEITREDTLAQNMLPRVGTGLYTGSTYAKSRIGVELGIGYRIDISKNIYLAPNIRYQYMITELNTNFQAEDISQTFTQTVAVLSYDKSTLNTLAIILQLGFTL